jgi:uncharacterized repeat protein (TIGR01451 family)
MPRWGPRKNVTVTNTGPVTASDVIAALFVPAA